MALPIKGIEKLSVIDFPGKTCCIVFLADCNFRCPYCHNPDLIRNPQNMPDITEKEVLDFIESRKKWVDGVCITGGEPCLHKELPSFIRSVKERGFIVKLDTNGSRPEMVKSLIDEGLLDYIAMDVKAPPERYPDVAGVKVDIEKIRETVDIIMKSGVEYEFRTTLVPRLFGRDDMEKIGRWLNGAKRFFLQNFKSGNTLDESFKNESSFSEEELKELADIAGKYFRYVGVRQ